MSLIFLLKQEMEKLFEKETTKLILIFIAVLWITDIILRRVRNRNRPPGPIGLPLVGSLPFLGKEPHKAMAKMAEKYGNIFGLYMGTKYTVALNDFDSMKEGLGHPAALDRAVAIFAHIKGGMGFEDLNGSPWMEQRSFCMQAMRDLGFGKGSWQVMIHEEISSFMEELSTLEGKPANIAPLLSTSISNNVISLLIGRRLQRGSEDHIFQLFRDFANVSLQYMGPSDPATLLPGFRKVLEFLKIGGYHKVPKITNNTNKFLKKEIFRQKSVPEFRDEHSFINSYLDRIESGKDERGKNLLAFNEKILEGNLNVLFLGGSDTIFNSMCFLIRLMAGHPHTQNKIHEELDCVLGREGKAEYEERSKTPYTFAAILEAQRYASLVPLTTTRLVNHDFELGGYTIPKGAEIFGNTWAVHNDPKYWKDPEKFLPERFLSEDGTEILKLPNFVPFSVGKRNCPGETVAWMEIYLYLTSVMQSYSIQPVPGEDLNFKIKNGLVIQLEPQNLIFTKRTS